MQVCLRVLVELFWGDETLSVDDIGRAKAKRVLGDGLLTASTVGGDVNNVDLVALVKVVGRPSLAVVRCVQPFCT